MVTAAHGVASEIIQPKMPTGDKPVTEDRVHLLIAESRADLEKCQALQHQENLKRFEEIRRVLDRWSGARAVVVFLLGAVVTYIVSHLK